MKEPNMHRTMFLRNQKLYVHNIGKEPRLEEFNWMECKN